MPNPFGKTRPLTSPYAIFKEPASDSEFRVLKTYRIAKNEDDFARWLVTAKTEYTFGSWETGDSYALAFKRGSRFLVAATPEFHAAYPALNVLMGVGGLPTPEEYLANQETTS